MKIVSRPLVTLLFCLSFCICNAASTFTLNPLGSFGPLGDGTIKPGQSLGFSTLPNTNGVVPGNEVDVSAPNVDLTGGVTNNATGPNGFGWQPGDSAAGPNSTIGFNMRGLIYDAMSQHLIFVDTHTGSGGSQTNPPNAAIYILDKDTGQIIDTLTPSITNLNSLQITNDGSGVGVFSVPGAADDGAIYACGQINANANVHFKIWRWPTPDTNNPGFTKIPTLAASTIPAPIERIGQTMAVRGAGTNTQIICGTSSLGGTGTNVYLFTTADGTNFTPHRLFFPGITTPVFNDGIAFGPGTNTFFTKQVGQPLNFLAWNPSTFAGSVIASYSGVSPSDPLVNLSAIAYDPVNSLLAGLEEIGGVATAGNGKVWLYDFPSPTNHAPAILATRVYTVNFQKTTAPMGYVTFGNGRLYAHASNNGFLVSSVDSVPAPLPTYIWTDYGLDGRTYTRSNDLPAITRMASGGSAHFEVFAVPDVTNYQWFSNGVLIAGVNGNSLDVPNVTTNMDGTVYQAIAQNAAGSSNSAASTLQVVSAANFFHLNLLWSITANNIALGSPTNFITSSGASSTPNERCIAYNALSNQLLIVRGPSAQANLKIFVITDPEALITTNGGGLYTNSFYPTGFPTNVYLLKTNGINAAQNLTLCGIGVADDGFVYASSVASDTSYKIYMWTNTDPNTVPITIFGTNSSANSANPIANPAGSTTFRFGDNLAVRGSGINTEILVDAQNNSKWFAILTPTDSTMTNWTSIGNIDRNVVGSYGSQAYGTAVGRSLQFGQGNTFWQKRYNAAGAPLSEMSYTPGDNSFSAGLVLANTGLPLYTNGQIAINFNLNVGVALNYASGGVGNNVTSPDTLSYYDLSNPSQAVLLGSANLPGANAGGRLANGNPTAQIVFGQNRTSGTNYVFVLEGNNGFQVYTLAGGVFPPPKILAQPKNLRLLLGGSGTMDVGIDQTATVSWFKGTNSPIFTGIQGVSYSVTNAAFNDVADYFAIATNINGAVTSAMAHVSVSVANDEYSLAKVWGTAAVPASAANYVSSDGGANTPNERAFAYNAPSNQLIVVRCPPNSTAYMISVVNALTGAFLYTMNTSGVIHEGASEVTGANAIDLVGAGAADDGCIYICCTSPNASGGLNGDVTKMWNLYRWTNSAVSTPPVLVFRGDPSFQAPGVNERWGDVLTVRGSGTNTEIYLNSQDGAYGAVLMPIDNSLNTFTNYFFIGSAGSGSLGRSVQFGTNNTVFEKRKGSALVLSVYDTNLHSSTAIASTDFSTTLGGVAVDSAHSLAIGVDFVGSATKPDAVALYDISDPISPLLVNQYNFPTNQVANANVICQTIVSGNRVWSLDANNGLMFLNIVPPVNSMKLNITPEGNNVNLSWGNAQAILQSSSSLSPQNWIDIAGPGVTNSVQPASGTTLYRLIQRL